MIKHFVIIAILLGVCIWGNANDNRDHELQSALASPALRNSIKFNYDLINDNNVVSDLDCLSDDFNIPVLRSHWNAGIDETRWSLRERPGFLRIKAQQNTGFENLTAETSLSHNFGLNTKGEALAFIDLSTMGNNLSAGLYFRSSAINYIGIQSASGLKRLIVFIDNQLIEGPVIDKNSIMLQMKFNISKAWFEYSYDGINFTQLGSGFQLNVNSTNNSLIGLYCLGDDHQNSSVDFDWFYCNQIIDDTLKFAENTK